VPQGIDKSFAGQRQRRSFMEKKKIAESIIIRVGGGIRSISREPNVPQDAIESALNESEFEQSEDMHSLDSELESTLKNSNSKVIN